MFKLHKPLNTTMVMARVINLIIFMYKNKLKKWFNKCDKGYGYGYGYGYSYGYD